MHVQAERLSSLSGLAAFYSFCPALKRWAIIDG